MKKIEPVIGDNQRVVNLALFITETQNIQNIVSTECKPFLYRRGGSISEKNEHSFRVGCFYFEEISVGEIFNAEISRKEDDFQIKTK